MRIVVTGANGFIGRNLRLRLREAGYTDVADITLDSKPEQVTSTLASADFVFHLAGVNRPKVESEFITGNVDFTEQVCACLTATGRPIPILFTSSTQAALDNPYGHSKLAAEQLVLRYGRDTSAPVHIFRLTNVFGKWCQPNYNSAVATFCHNLVHGLPITVHDPAAPLRLVHVDDVLDAFLARLAAPTQDSGYAEVMPVHETTVGEVVRILREIAANRTSLTVPEVGRGLGRALYTTYVSYLPPALFPYDLVRHTDPRGIFVEVLKTPGCGQFSYFTAHPGVTRGGHYHQSKTEKFLVIQGNARFGFRHVVTGERHELVVRGGDARVVETVPGWAHDITNIGEDLLIVMLWANEQFDPARPDTIAMQVGE
jgi:UDP-2-acetamido-2,6-beta-L-arabino-hexul-4-ose reductase